MPKPKRWQEDEAFVEWMIREGHAYRDGTTLLCHHFTNDALVHYMYDAFCAGRASK